MGAVSENGDEDLPEAGWDTESLGEAASDSIVEYRSYAQGGRETTPQAVSALARAGLLLSLARPRLPDPVAWAAFLKPHDISRVEGWMAVEQYQRSAGAAVTDGCRAETSSVARSPKRPPRVQHEFFSTPRPVTLALLNREGFDGTVWEPACGDGAMARVLSERGCEVVASDIVDRGYGEVADFLTTHRAVDHVVTNPPFSKAVEFVRHGLRCARRKVAIIQRLQFLEGGRRVPFFRETPLKAVYVFAKRVTFFAEADPGRENTTTAHAWFVWEHGYRGEPVVRHIPAEDLTC